MERNTDTRRNGDDRTEIPDATTNEEPTWGEGGADGATGITQAAYDKAKDDAVKDIHG